MKLQYKTNSTGCKCWSNVKKKRSDICSDCTEMRHKHGSTAYRKCNLRFLHPDKMFPNFLLNT